MNEFTPIILIPANTKLGVLQSLYAKEQLSISMLPDGHRATTVVAVLVLATVITSLFSAACATGTGGPGTVDGLLVPTTEMFRGTAPSDVAASGTDSAAPGGTLKVGFSCVESLDPVIGDCHGLFNEVYARLVSYSDNPGMPVVPDLADSYRVSDGGKTYTFTLRRDLKFSDGSPLSALDFKWSWERALRPDTGSTNARTALGLIVGADEVSSGDSEELRGVEVVDDRTLRVHLTTPARAFIFNMADHVATPLKRDNVSAWGSSVDGVPSADETDAATQLAFEAANPGQLPIGTGPFRFSEGSIRGFENMKIERNPFTHRQKPNLDNVEFVKDWIETGKEGELNLADRLFVLYQSGAIDIAHFAHPDTVSDDGSNRIRKLPDGVVFLAFNTAVPPFDDVDVRRALVAASDVAGVHEGGEALSLMWPDIPGYIPELSVNRFDPEHDFKPADGKDLQSFGTLPWCIWSNESGGTFARAHLQPHFDKWQEATGLQIRNDTYICDDGASEVGVIHVYAKLLYVDPHSIFEAFPRLFPDTHGDYAHVRAMIAEAESTADSVVRLQRYAEIEQYLHDQALVLPVKRTNWSIPEHVRNTVRGYNPKLYGGSTYSSVWLDQSAR